MAEILETIMLVCFGCSWPMNAYKNAKAKSAKNMSLSFTLLIITGYVAGIAAKFVGIGTGSITVTGKTIFVLAVYFLNLIMVSANVVIYFINKKYDKQAEAAKVK